MGRNAPLQIAFVGTGLTALTAASKILRHPSRQIARIIFIDKAKAPGGRLTSRTYKDVGVTDVGLSVEPGARAFQTRSPAFKNAARIWEGRGWVRQLPRSRLLGVQDEAWWEAAHGGWTGSLIAGLVGEINDLGGDEVEWRFNTTAEPSVNPLRPIISPQSDFEPDVLVYTAPSPQTRNLLPSIRSPEASYTATFALIFPSVNLPPSYPAYSRDPHTKLSSISTGTEERPLGMVVQASPAQLGLENDRKATSDEVIRTAMLDVMFEARLAPEEALQAMRIDRHWQVKRWKYAQVDELDDQAENLHLEQFNEGWEIIAGDGLSQIGGVEGAWHSGQAVAAHVIGLIENKNGSLAYSV